MSCCLGKAALVDENNAFVETPVVVSADHRLAAFLNTEGSTGTYLRSINGECDDDDYNDAVYGGHGVLSRASGENTRHFIFYHDQWRFSSLVPMYGWHLSFFPTAFYIHVSEIRIGNKKYPSVLIKKHCFSKYFFTIKRYSGQIPPLNLIIYEVRGKIIPGSLIA